MTKNHNILKHSLHFLSRNVFISFCYRGLKYTTAIAIMVGVHLGTSQLMSNNKAWGLEIVASFRPVHSLVSGVVGDNQDVTILMEGDASPHDFTLTPAKMRALENADIIFRVSPTLENFLNRLSLRENSDASDGDNGMPIMINLVKGGDRDPMCIGKHHSHNHHQESNHRNHGDEKHDHARHDDNHDGHDKHHDDHDKHHDDHDDHDKHHDDHDGHDKHHDDHDDHDKHHDGHDKHHDDHDDHDKHHDGHDKHHDQRHQGNKSKRMQENQPCHGGEIALRNHSWLDPIDAIVMVQKIATTLSNFDPENTEKYERNAAEMAQDIAKINQELSSQLRNSRGVSFMATHDSYGKFAQRYNLDYKGAIDDHELTAGKPRKRRSVLKLVNEGKIHCILKENQFNPPILDIISKNKSLNIVTIDTIGGQQEIGKDLYVNMMRAIGNQVEQCLS